MFFWHPMALTVARTEKCAFSVSVCDLHMKQLYDHPENGRKFPPEVRGKLSAGIVTNWLN